MKDVHQTHSKLSSLGTRNTFSVKVSTFSMNSLSTICHSNINKVLSHQGPIIMYIIFYRQGGNVNAVSYFIFPSNLRYKAFYYSTQRVHRDIFAYILQPCRLCSGKRLLMTLEK